MFIIIVYRRQIRTSKVNPLKHELIVEIFVNYKPRIVSAIVDL